MHQVCLINVVILYLQTNEIMEKKKIKTNLFISISMIFTSIDYVIRTLEILACRTPRMLTNQLYVSNMKYFDYLTGSRSRFEH